MLSRAKRFTIIRWGQIFLIWTLVAMSMSTQLYLNTVLDDPLVSWVVLFLKQLPAWYLCALLTGISLIFYDLYPLDNPDWKKNLVRQGFYAIAIVLLFSHARVAALAFSIGKDIRDFTSREYLNSYLSQLAWDLAIYILITMAVFADKTNTKRRQKELIATEMELRNKELENQLNIAQLEALKLQLSPHFLFNTLNTVSALIRTHDNGKAIQVNSMLGDFLRSTLYMRHDQFVSLEEEIRLSDLYLNIELLRFSDRLKIKKEITRESLHVQVPHFILQPIIENSIKHGVAVDSKASVISLRAFIKEDLLHVSVYNDGTLLPEHWSLKESTGIGVKNVAGRLEKIYGDSGKLSIRNHPEKNGVEVSLHIPVARA